MQVESALFFESPEEIYARVFRHMKPRTPVPDIHVEFCAFANANSTIRSNGARLEVRITDVLRDAPAPILEALAMILIGKLYRKPIPRAYAYRYRLYLNRKDVRQQLANPDVQVIITTGGTGITSRDSTYEAIAALLEKRLDGFGELFRVLSYEQIGASAMMSRACAGLAKGRIIMSLPGSENAVRLAMEKLIVPELGHLVQQASR